MSDLARHDVNVLAEPDAPGPVPASIPQQRIWFLSRLEDAEVAYNIAFGVHLRGALEIGALRRAVADVAARHESLRTGFIDRGGSVHQVIAPSLDVPLTFAALEGCGAPDVQVRGLARMLTGATFDFGKPPLWRVCICRVDPSEHVLLLALHHIICDGRSIRVLLHDIAEAYGRRLSGAEPAPPLRIQYADYMRQQEHSLRTRPPDADAKYWIDQLEGAMPSPLLPGHRRQERGRTRGETLTFVIPPHLTEMLRSLCRREKATPFMGLLAVWLLLLHRYSLDRHVYVGTAFDNRDSREAEMLVGLCVNMLVLRGDASGNPPFIEYLRRVALTVLDAADHARLPFAWLVEKLRPTRGDAGRTPLFQGTFDFQTSPTASIRMAGLEVELVPLDSGITSYEIETGMVDAGHVVFGTFRYDRDVFDRTTMRRVSRHFLRLLEAACDRPADRVFDLPLLDHSEYHRLTIESNDSAIEYPRDTSLGTLAENVASERPDAVAMEFGDLQITYGELVRRADAIAQQLLASYEPGARIGLAVGRTPAFVIAALGVVRAGMAYVPLDSAAPAGWLESVVEDAELDLVLTEAESHAAFVNLAVPAIVVDGLPPAVHRLPLPRVNGGDMAYVMFTSGSTGTPKGVMIPHRAVVRLIVGANYVDLGPDTRIAFASHLTFDATTLELWGALLCGARLVAVDRLTLMSPNLLEEQLQRDLVTVMFVTPPLLQRIASDNPAAFRTLDTLLVGGDAMDPIAARRIIRSGPSCRLVNAYGPTESTTFATSLDVTEAATVGPVPIGRPISNTQAYVLDQYLQPVPCGSIGEVCLGGDGLAIGYAGRPDLTADRFRPDALSGARGARLYKTGDYGRLNRDGHIEYLGRCDRQVKVRGHRVELDHIASAVAEHPLVRAQTVVARRAGHGDLTVVAYVVLAPDCESVAPIREHLQRTLPGYMIPALVAIPALPITANGKVDQANLPDPSLFVERVSDTAPPGTELEEVVSSVWSSLLGGSPPDLHQNFFEAGGHSLLAMHIVTRLRELLGVELPLASFFAAPTVAGLAAAVSSAGHARQPLRRIGPAASGEIPLSYAQQRLWFLEHSEPDSAAYNSPLAFHLQGSLDLTLVQRALGAIVRRHDALRARYVLGRAGPVQVFDPPGEFCLRIADLQGLAADGAARECERLAHGEGIRRIDLARGPLFRAAIVRLAPDDHVLLMTAHHSIVDGRSVEVLLEEFEQFYVAMASGRAFTCPPLPIQYSDYAVWQRATLSGTMVNRLLEFWKRQLAPPVPASAFRPVRPCATSRSTSGGLGTFELSADLSTRVRALSRREGTTPLATLLAAFLLILHADTGQPVLQVGTDVAGRDHPDVDSLIGFFVNVVVLRVSLEGDPSFRHLLERVHDVLAGALSHQDLPFEMLVRELRPERAAGQTPLVHTIFSLRYDEKPFRQQEAPFRMSPISTTVRARWDCALTMRSQPDYFHGTWIYARDLYDPDTIGGITAAYKRVIERAVTDPALSVTALLRDAHGDQKERVMGDFSKKRPSLSTSAPAPVSIATERLVTAEPLEAGRTLPLVVRSVADDVDLAEWVAANRAFVHDRMKAHGALLFRGFRVATIPEFERVAEAVSPDLFRSYGDLPRESVSEKVYNATPYPADQRIEFHNEGVHTRRWPLHIFFFCTQPAQKGGETPLVDCREMARRLDAELLARFAKKRVKYVRNFLFDRDYVTGLDVSWHEFFRTTDRSEVEAQCRALDLEAEWTANNGLRISAVCPVVAHHPGTGEIVFFHQMFTHHIACLEPALRQSVLLLFPVHSLPRNVYYGDGMPIDDSVIASLRSLYDAHRVQFAWQKGDVMAVDNMLTAHSRNPFQGPRKISVAMADMVTASDLALPSGVGLGGSAA